MEIVKENNSINAHSLILVDIGLDFETALKELEKSAKEHKIKLDKIIVCSRLGTRYRKIFYEKVGDLFDEDIDAPFCFIIPGKLHFVEEEMLGEWGEKNRKD